MPPIGYWFSGAALFLAGSTAFATIVSLIGIKPIMAGKYFYILVVFAAVLSFAAWWFAAKQQWDSDDLRRQIVGSQSHPLVLGEILNHTDLQTPLPIMVMNTDTLPLYDVNLVIAKESKTAQELAQNVWTEKRIIVGTILGHDYRVLNERLPFGNWTVRIGTKGGSFRETISIFSDNGHVNQKYKVFRVDGEEMANSEHGALKK